MLNRIFVRPMVPLLISMTAGILLGAQFPDYIQIAYTLLFISLTSTLFCSLKKITPFPGFLAVFFLLGYALIHSFVAPEFPLNHITRFTGKHKWHIRGTIVTKPVVYGKRLRFNLGTELLDAQNGDSPVTGKIRVAVSGKAPDLRVGDKIFFSSRIRTIRNFMNPGGFDYKRYMAFRGIWGSAYIRGDKIRIIKRRSPGDWGTMLANVRQKISCLIDQVNNKDQAAILKALIIGDKSEIRASIRESFSRAGVSHLLAISGLHIGIVAGVAFLFFSWVLSFFKVFLWHAWTKKGAAILSIIPVVMYGILSGMSPPTQRAVIMVSVFLAAFIFEKQHDPFNTIAIAAMLILIIHPPSIFSVSFQLSFAAVFSIIYGMALIYKKSDNQSAHNKTIFAIACAKLFTFSLVSAFAIIGTIPLVMYYFNQISLAGIITNLFAVPLTGFIIVPLGLFSLPACLFSIDLALLSIRASGYMLGFVLKAVKFIACLPWAAYKTLTPSCFEICLYYLIFLTVLRIIHNIINSKKIFPDKTNIKAGIPVLALFFLLTAGCCDLLYWLNRRILHDDLRVTILDVGQGSAALVELPKGECLLVDGGGFSDNAIFDMGAKVLAPFLWRNKILTINTIILSHPNSDHLNGLIYIAKHFNVQTVLSNGEEADTLGYKEFVAAINKNKIEMCEFRQLTRKQNIGKVTLEILYPPPEYSEKKHKEKWRDLNNNSVVVKISYGAVSFLFPGDIEARAEQELVAINGGRLRSRVLIAPHHGSKSSSTSAFLRSVRPEWVIISSGFNNRFGFPDPEVIDRYKLLGIRILCTSQNGALILKTDGQSLSITP